MKTIHFMLLRIFAVFFLIAILFFVLVLELLDVFANLWRYLAQDTPPAAILHIAWLYLPKCISYSIAPSLLFAGSYSLGLLYKNNELISILGSGLSLYRLVLPLLVLGLALSAGGFYFEETVVIDTFQAKNQLYRATIKQEVSFSNTNVTVMSEDSRTIYQVEYYNDKKQSLTQVLILRRDVEGRFASRIDADWAEWNGKNWVLHNGRRYLNDLQTGIVSEEKVGILDDQELVEPPTTFRKTTRRIEELQAAQARDWVTRLRRAGLPFREALTEYYKKFFFALNPLIVALIASGIGGRFRKNVLLMNLLAALILTVIYYVGQMISLILAKNGLIPPLAGAGMAFLVFLAGGLLLLRTART
jgi:lipopolysaccharide export system permease protein